MQVGRNKLTLYKYRSLENFERFLDILINERIHASKFYDLNDPMEGYIYYSKDMAKLYNDFKTEMERYFICSFSKNPNIGLMWVHYANEGKGCCLELEINQKNVWTKHEVNYVKEMSEITNDTVVEDLLCRKFEVWEYEKEIRYLRLPQPSNEKTQSMKFNVKIKKIFLGYNVPQDKRRLIETLVKRLFPNKGIVVEKIDKNNLIWNLEIIR